MWHVLKQINVQMVCGNTLGYAQHHTHTKLVIFRNLTSSGAKEIQDVGKND